MSNAAEEMTECINALTELVSALHRLMDNYPDLREHLLPATLRLSETLPCVSFFLSMDTGEINKRLTDVERRLSVLEVDVAQLKADVAQIKLEVARISSSLAQIREAIAGMNARMDSLATKEELHIALHKQTWRISGVITALVAAVYFIADYLH
ncbi:hypothetical protein ABT364_25765 [Massilia sp. SR12]